MVARSIARLKHGLDRVDVSLSLRKWWTLGYTRQNGLITKTLSPFEQKIISPLFEDAPTKIMKYLKRWSITIGPAGVLCYSTVKWADWEFDQIHLVLCYSTVKWADWEPDQIHREHWD